MNNETADASNEWRTCEICKERKAQVIHEEQEICVLCRNEILRAER